MDQNSLREICRGLWRTNTVPTRKREEGERRVKQKTKKKKKKCRMSGKLSTPVFILDGFSTMVASVAHDSCHDSWQDPYALLRVLV